jgi:hydrogenase expression/formation protein HypE
MSKPISMNHGAGGRQMHELINKLIMQKLGNGILERMDDSAVLENQKAGRIAMTTDSYVVSPLFFEGGDIGRLSVCGTVNDLTTSGATPYALSLAFILEEGVEYETLEKIVTSIAETAKEAGVKIVTGDTKVVEKGKGDQIYINTCGIGFIEDGINISTYNAKAGDKVLITGSIGDHEIAMMKARGMIEFEIDVRSDAAPLNKKMQKVIERTKNLHVVKDPTRGGVASALIEIAEHSKVGIKLFETKLPISPQVKGVCELVGFDPLYLANEGKFIVICPPADVHHVQEVFGRACYIIGEVNQSSKPEVLLEVATGGLRRIGMLETTQLPRIC